jgi:hypothetical protein
VGAPDCLSTDARRRADANGRKAAAPASAAGSRAVRRRILPGPQDLDIRAEEIHVERQY